MTATLAKDHAPGQPAAANDNFQLSAEQETALRKAEKWFHSGGKASPDQPVRTAQTASD